MAKVFTTSAEWKLFSLLKRGTTFEDVMHNGEERFSDSNIELHPVTLEKVPSSQENTRKGHLIKNIYSRYNCGDSVYEDQYFGDGMDWKEL